MHRKSQKGALTIFLSIILAVTIFLTGTFVEAARIHIANSQVTRALMNAKTSALAGYNTELKNNYGLFAVCNIANNDLESTLEETLYYFMLTTLRPHETIDAAGLIATQGEYWNLFDYEIQDIEVRLYHSLNNPKVLKRQILEHMRFRAPLRLAIRAAPDGLVDQATLLTGLFASPTEKINKIVPENSFSEKIDKLSDIGNAGNTIKMKTKIDRQLFGLSELLVDLSHKINEINDFSKSDFETRMDVINRESREYSDLLTWAEEEEKRLEESIQIILAEIRNLGPDEQEARDALNEGKRALEEQLDEVRKEVKIARQVLQNKVSYERTTMLGLDSANSNAIVVIDNAIEEVVSFSEKVDNFGRHLETNKNSLVDDQMREAYNNYRKIAVEGLEVLRALVEKNILVLAECLKYIDSIGKAIDALENLSPSERNDKLLVITNKVGSAKGKIAGYSNDLQHVIVAPSPDDSLSPPPDPREEIAEDALDEIIRKIVGTSIPGEVFRKLPSNLEVMPDDINQPEVGTIEFNEKEEGGFLDRTLASATDSLGNISKLPTDLRNALFINEYIAGIFKSRITLESIKDESINNFEAIYDINLRNEPKSDRDAFLCFEMEYILFGNRRDVENLTAVVSIIVAIRFTANLVYASKKHLKTASKIAATVAAKSTVAAPLVYPLVKGLVLGAYAIKYTTDDIDNLLSGQEVLIYRGKENLTMNYEDYLKFFLLTASINYQEKKLMRINDLIQMNMQIENVKANNFEMIDFYTYIDTQASMSIRNIFLNIIDKTEELGFEHRARHNFNITVMDGY